MEGLERLRRQLARREYFHGHLVPLPVGAVHFPERPAVQQLRKLDVPVRDVEGGAHPSAGPRLRSAELLEEIPEGHVDSHAVDRDPLSAQRTGKRGFTVARRCRFPQLIDTAFAEGVAAGHGHGNPHVAQLDETDGTFRRTRAFLHRTVPPCFFLDRNNVCEGMCVACGWVLRHRSCRLGVGVKGGGEEEK